jgi:predicted metal-binding membrane protein
LNAVCAAAWLAAGMLARTVGQTICASATTVAAVAATDWAVAMTVLGTTGVVQATGVKKMEQARARTDRAAGSRGMVTEEPTGARRVLQDRTIQ